MKKVLVGLPFALMAIVVIATATMPLASLRAIPAEIAEVANERWGSSVKRPPIRAGDVVFLGDSITASGSWEELFPGTGVKNYGVGGDMTQGVLARLAEITDAHPAKVFLMIGTNDLYAERDQAYIVNNVREIIARLRSASPETSVYLQSVLPRELARRQAVEALNRAYAEIARESNVRWIDLYPVFLADDGSMRDDLANDEVHLTSRGYVVWRDQILPFIKQS